jgi:hypothetical protein
MRSKDKPASLKELIGGEGEISTDNLREILGEKMPELPMNRIGKYRLINALKVRFGPGYRNIPGVAKVIKDFSDKVETENVIRLNKASRS